MSSLILVVPFDIMGQGLVTFKNLCMCSLSSKVLKHDCHIADALFSIIMQIKIKSILFIFHLIPIPSQNHINAAEVFLTAIGSSRYLGSNSQIKHNPELNTYFMSLGMYFNGDLLRNECS